VDADTGTDRHADKDRHRQTHTGTDRHRQTQTDIDGQIQHVVSIFLFLRKKHVDDQVSFV